MIPKSKNLKPVEFAPMNGLMDMRSSPGNMNASDYRFLQNVSFTGPRNMCRSNGWSRLLSDDGAGNTDLHDQLDALDEQKVTMLFEAESLTGATRLLAGTQNRIYSIDRANRTFHIISDELGGTYSGDSTGLRFKAAQLDDVVVFTNGVDKVVYWSFDQSENTDGQSVQEIPDLSTIGITSAKTVFEWKGFMFLANLVMDGVFAPARIVWSDFRRPLAFKPTSASLAGFQDLGGIEEAIIAAKDLGDVLLIYTTRGIWQASVSGGDGTFSFQRRYGDQLNGNACLAYENSLVSTGDNHYFFGRDGIYKYNLYLPAPEKTMWLNNAAYYIFQSINQSACKSVIGEFNYIKDEVWWSWPSGTRTNNNRSLKLNVLYDKVAVIDVGFSAMGNYRPTSGSTLRKFLIDYCACSESDLEVEAYYAQDTEACGQKEEVTECDTLKQYVYTSAIVSVDGVETENWWAGSSSANSLCESLGDRSLVSICDDVGAGGCPEARLFIFVDNVDNCIKQESDVLYRERCVDKTDCGEYETQGYETILRSGPLSGGLFRRDKRIRAVELEFESQIELDPLDMNLRIGVAQQAADSNTDSCNLLWHELTPKPIECYSHKYASQHAADNTRPWKSMYWNCNLRGQNIYYEFSIDGIGGACCFSGLRLLIGAV